MTDIQFNHYSHRIDHDNPVVELAITLLLEEPDPERSEFVQAFADGVMKLLIDLREKFPREKFDYYGTRFEEWLGDQPTQEPYLMSKEDLPEHTTIVVKETGDPVTVEEWYKFVEEEQREEDEEFSREKITNDLLETLTELILHLELAPDWDADTLPMLIEDADKAIERARELSREKSGGCDDPYDLEDTLFMKPHVESREDVIVEGIETKNLRINEGVAPHVITRKYYPFAHCVSCNKKNTDYCRLVCEDESKIEEFSHEK